ncbi:MAG: ankyrin repeat domain-containing protein [Alphaproteobacteria bacterium]|nr:ankyrin repeat domain-containing protein [Alphaproteobacteria bacterium]
MNNYEDTWAKLDLRNCSETDLIRNIKELLSENVDVNVRDRSGHTFLMQVVCLNNKQATEFLINHGADVNLKSNNGQTAIMFAAYFGYSEMMKFLIDHGADVNAQTQMGWTALMEAAQSGQVEAVKILIERGADVNISDKDGHTVSRYKSNKDIKKLIKNANEIREAYLNVATQKKAPQKNVKKVSKHYPKLIDLGKMLAKEFL